MDLNTIGENSNTNNIDSNHVPTCLNVNCTYNENKSNRCIKICKSVKSSRFVKCSFYRNNSEYFLFIIIYFIVQILLSLLQLWLYWDVNTALKVARVGGILLSFNFAFSLFLVLRKLLTWLRNTKFGQICLPLDDFLDFHKYIGVFILLMSIMHTIGHCINLCKNYFHFLFFNIKNIKS
jgi:hypothetical protein